MMSVLGIAAVYRLIRHGDAVMEQLRHPVEGSFYATFPIAMLVMAAVWTIRGVSPALDRAALGGRVRWAPLP